MKLNFPPDAVALIEKGNVIFSLNGKTYRIEPFDWHENPPQQESWEDRFYRELPDEYINWHDVKSFISTERQRVLNEVRGLVGTLGTYRTARNIETLSKHDLLSALKEMKQ